MKNQIFHKNAKNHKDLFFKQKKVIFKVKITFFGRKSVFLLFFSL